MQLRHDCHLAYCTNIHRGESWEETFLGLKTHTLGVRDRICAPGTPYAIGLRLSARAAVELENGTALAEFRNWLDETNCYIFTINGFPFGAFHGTRVKEKVYLPDWTSEERVDYTMRLFRILAALQPPGGEGSVSTLPGSFKAFAIGQEGLEKTLDNMARMALFLDDLSEKSGLDLHLGLEPEPLGLFETTGETIKYFGLLFDRHSDKPHLLKRIGVNFDTCHLAIEFENTRQSLQRLHDHGIRLSKLHLSSALKLIPTDENLQTLARFQEEVYLHQVVQKDGDEPLRRFVDLPEALAAAGGWRGEEWRVHFHVPLHAGPGDGLQDTRDELLGTLDWLADDPSRCHHLEMETYTWEVLPPALRQGTVVDQLEKEYRWCWDALTQRDLTNGPLT
jgi:hypothetical protein